MKLKLLILFLIISASIVSCTKEKETLNVDKKEYDKKDLEKDYDCFYLIYPVSYMMPDSTKITGIDQDEIKKLIIAWYKLYPNNTKKPEFIYPCKVKFNGKIIEISNEKEMIKLKKACK